MYRDAAERLRGVPPEDLKAILDWCETTPEAGWFLDPDYLHPLFQQLAAADPDFCRAALLAQSADGSPLDPLLIRQLWPAYYLGLSQRDPIKALHEFEEDSVDQPKTEFPSLNSLVYDLCAAAAKVDTQEVLVSLLRYPKNQNLLIGFEGFCQGAPRGQNWGALADQIMARLAENEKRGEAAFPFSPDDEVNRAAAVRWVQEDPAAALDWYADRESTDEIALSEESRRATRRADLIAKLASDPSAPDSAAGDLVTQLIRSGEPSDLEVADKCLSSLIRPLSDSRWMNILATLPEDDSRAKIFLSAVSQVKPRVPDSGATDTSDPFAGSFETLPEDDSPNPSVVALRPWIAKMNLSAENAAKAEASLQAVEEREAARRRGEPDPPPDPEADPFSDGR